MPPRDFINQDNNNSSNLMNYDDGSPNNEEGNNDEDDYDDDDFDSEDDDYDSEEDIDDAFGDFLMAAVHSQGEELRAQHQAVAVALGGGAPAVVVDPKAEWSKFLSKLSQGSTKVLKITDACYEKYGLVEVSIEEQAKEANAISIKELIVALQASPVVSFTHVILGDKAARLVNQEPGMMAAVLSHKVTNSLTYLKLSPSDLGVLEVDALLSILAQSRELTELEIHNLQVSQGQVAQLAEILKASKLTQINLFGIATDALDSLVTNLGALQTLDELRLEGRNETTISTNALESLLDQKFKWWRLGLDSLNLTDEHCAVIARMFARNDAYKAGDLLSLIGNPKITTAGYKCLFEVFFNKGRMGLIKVDDKTWEAEFDLVRSMNNLHGRLDIVQGGKVVSKDAWVEWARKLGSQGWEPDSKKLNYIWFALRQTPQVLE